MRNNKLEFITGLFILAGFASLVLLAFKVSGLNTSGSNDTYTVVANFDNIVGLTARSKVTMAGVLIGKVTNIELDKSTYLGRVTMEINKNANNIPIDSTASILTAGILGEKYIGISVGGESEFLKNNSVMTDTQSSLVLEELIGKVLLSMFGDKKD